MRSAADGETALFVSTFGTKPGTRMSRRSVYNVVAGRLGSHPHMLRHCAVTTMVEKNLHPSVIQKICGHSSPSTTQLYISLNDKFVQSEFAAKMAA